MFHMITHITRIISTQYDIMASYVFQTQYTLKSTLSLYYYTNTHMYTHTHTHIHTHTLTHTHTHTYTHTHIHTQVTWQNKCTVH